MKKRLQDEIIERLEKIESLLNNNKIELLNLNQAAQYLSISHSQLYKYTSQRKIPFHKPAGKYLYFFKHELDEWIVNNSKLEIQNSKLEIKDAKLEEDRSREPGLFDEEEETEPP